MLETFMKTSMISVVVFIIENNFLIEWLKEDYILMKLNLKVQNILSTIKSIQVEWNESVE